jgi:N-acetylglucosamine-6-sulfatase
MLARRCALAAAILVTLAGLAPVALGETATASARVDARPNILLITTDDQNLSDMKYMPLTRRVLGDAGVTFRNMLSPHPLCCPSRAEMVTGQYAHNNGVRSNRESRHGGWTYLDNKHTLATWLHQAGYRTAFVGKYLNQYPSSGGSEPGWDTWNPLVRQVYRYFGYTLYEDGHPQTYPGVHSSDEISLRTVDYVRRLAAGDEPFFVWASHVAPHGECDGGCASPPRPAVRHEGMFANVNSPSLSDPAFNEADVSDKPPSIAKLDKVDKSRMNLQFRMRIRSLQAVDEAVEAAVKALRSAGELDNTLILFTSDNGFLLGEHRYFRKDVPYEQAMRVPFLVRGPGVPHATRNKTVTMVDLAPTILDAANARASHPLDGRSVLPIARNSRARGQDTVLIQSGPKSKKQLAAGWSYRGVRTHRYTYVRYTRPAFIELYDRKKDPHEMRNVAGKRKYHHVQHDLARRLKKLKNCGGASCRKRFE